MGIPDNESKLDNKLDIKPTNYSIETFTPVFEKGQKHCIVPLRISGEDSFFYNRSKRFKFAIKAGKALSKIRAKQKYATCTGEW